MYRSEHLEDEPFVAGKKGGSRRFFHSQGFYALCIAGLAIGTLLTAVVMTNYYPKLEKEISSWEK